MLQKWRSILILFPFFFFIKIIDSELIGRDPQESLHICGEDLMWNSEQSVWIWEISFASMKFLKGSFLSFYNVIFIYINLDMHQYMITKKYELSSFPIYILLSIKITKNKKNVSQLLKVPYEWTTTTKRFIYKTLELRWRI